MRYGCVGLGRCVYLCIGKLSEGEGVICGICWFWSRGWVCDNKLVYSHYIYKGQANVKWWSEDFMDHSVFCDVLKEIFNLNIVAFEGMQWLFVCLG